MKIKLLIITGMSLIFIFLSGFTLELQKQLELEEAAIKAEIDSIEKRIKEHKEEILHSREVKPSLLINEYKNQLLKLNAELRKELEIYREKHPKIKKLQAKINYVEEKINEERENIVETKVYKQNPVYAELISNKNSLQTRLEGVKAQIEKIKQEKMQEKQEELQKEEDIQKEDQSKKDLTPVNESKKRKLLDYKNLIILILILILLILIKYLWSYFKKNRANSNNENELLGQLENVKKVKAVASVGEDAFIFHRPEHNAKEKLEKITSNIENRTKTFIISSIFRGMGKSFTAVNLACFWASKGKNTLLIDMNFENPKIHRTFLTDNESGLSDILLQTEENSAVIKETPVTNLDIITSGHNPLGAEEMLENTLFLEFIKEAEAKYERIIIDSASCESNEHALIAGKYIPVTMIISDLKQIEEVEEKCAYRNSVFLGAIINKK
ncbi:MAG: AAA family ATPase [Candidatus Muiribacteriota bacterium]